MNHRYEFRIVQFENGRWGVEERDLDAYDPNYWRRFYSTFNGRYRARQLANWFARRTGGTVVNP